MCFSLWSWYHRCLISPSLKLRNIRFRPNLLVESASPSLIRTLGTFAERRFFVCRKSAELLAFHASRLTLQRRDEYKGTAVYSFGLVKIYIKAIAIARGHPVYTYICIYIYTHIHMYVHLVTHSNSLSYMCLGCPACQTKMSVNFLWYRLVCCWEAQASRHAGDTFSSDGN